MAGARGVVGFEGGSICVDYFRLEGYLDHLVALGAGFFAGATSLACS